MSVESASQQSRGTSASIALSAALAVMFVVFALLLWLSLGSEVFLKIGSSAWALCF